MIKMFVVATLGILLGLVLAYCFPAHAQESQSEYYARAIEPSTNTAPDSFQHNWDGQNQQQQQPEQYSQPQYVPYYGDTNTPGNVYSTGRY